MSALYSTGADLKEGYFKSGEYTGRKYQFLRIPENFDSCMVYEDLEKEAEMFAPIMGNILEKKATRYIGICCDLKETGLQAVSYIESVYRSREEDTWHTDDAPFEAFVQEKLCDDPVPDDFYLEDRNIPVITGEELDQYLNSGLYVSAEDKVLNRYSRNLDSWMPPYWAERHSYPIIVLMDHINEGGAGKAVCERLKQLSLFSSNERVYLISVVPRSAYGQNGKTGTSRELVEFSLIYNANCASILPSEEKLLCYRKGIFRAIMEERGLSLAYDIDLEEVVKLFYLSDLFSTNVKRYMKRFMHENGSRTELTRRDFQMLGKLSCSGQQNASGKKDVLEDLVGADRLKEKMEEVICSFRYSRARAKAGLPVTDTNMIIALCGAPGVAKSTFARILAEKLMQEHILPEAGIWQGAASELCGKYLGWTSERVLEIFANNSAIILDELYVLDSDDLYSKQAIATLLQQMEIHRHDRLIVMTGYPREMSGFFQANAGIASRVTYRLTLENYGSEQMLEIVKSILCKRNLVLPKEADMILKEYFVNRVTDEYFGNGREGRQLADNIQNALSSRVMSMPHNALTRDVLIHVTMDDVSKAVSEMKTANEAVLGTGYGLFARGA